MQQVYVNKIYTCPLCRYDLMPALLKTNFKYQYFNSYVDYASIFDYASMFDYASIFDYDRNTYVPFAYARSTYARDAYARDAYARDAYARSTYARQNDYARQDARQDARPTYYAHQFARVPYTYPDDIPSADNQADNNLPTWSSLLLNFILDLSGNNVSADDVPADEQVPADIDEQGADTDNAPTELEILYYWYS